MFVQLPVINALLGISFLTTGILSTLLLIRSRVISSTFLSITSYGATLWILAMLVFMNVDNPLIVIIATKTLYIAGAVVITGFIYFSNGFISFDLKKNLKLISGMFVLFLISLFYIIFTDKVIDGVEFLNGEKIVNFGDFYYVYGIYIILGAFLGYYYLIKSFGSVKDKLKERQLIYIGLGTIFSITCGLLFDIILPFTGNFSFYWLGPVLTTIFVISISYAIFKHHLFNIKVITTEIFSIFISVAVLVDALIADSRLELILKLGIFVIVAIFSILLIRGVINEVSSREKITRMARSLKRANVELQKLDKAKSEFISIASHQLRTPLSIIKGFISMILEGFYGSVSDQAKDKLEKSLESNERLIKLVDHLLDLSHMEGGKMKFEFSKISLIKLVESSVEELELQAYKKKLKFVYHLPKAKEIFVRADEEKIRQVVINLIDNAIKYTAKGKIEIFLKKVGDKAVFSVKDTGIGIERGGIKHLFDKFIRGKKVARIWTEGVGLGLYIARLIIETHHGQIGVKSKGENKGSEFWFKIPIFKNDKGK